MSRTLSALQAILLGLLLLAGVGLVAGTVLTVGKWGSRFHVRAGFSSILGVEVGTKVRIKGIDAGEVVAIEAPVSTDDQVVLRLRINSKFRHLVRADAKVQIVSVGMLGGKAVEIDPGSASAPLAEEDAKLASKKATELTDVVDQVKSTLEDVIEGKGTIGKLSKDPQAYQSLVGALDSIRGAAQSVQADAEAIKDVPLIGGYVKDPRALLDRPGHERNPKWFAESDLFEPRRAVLTSQGKKHLDGLGDWIEGLKHSGSEVVVVSYADPAGGEPENARKVTQEQARVVLEHLKDRHKIHKLGLVSWRKATPLGMGVNPPPVAEGKNLPAARIGILVFVPQN